MMLWGRNSFYYMTFLVTVLSTVGSLSTYNDDDRIKRSERILSRKRRYLIFPVGSSIQLVYDSTITVPDYTLYVTTGVTCALAWGLPDKPTYPEWELMEKYENGSLPLLEYRQDKNVTNQVDNKGEINVSNVTANNAYTSEHLTNYYKQNYFSNYIRDYYKFLENRKVNSYYFGNRNRNSSRNRSNIYCNGSKCPYNDQITYQPNGGEYNYKSYNIRPPYSPVYNSRNYSEHFEQVTVNIVTPETTKPPTTTEFKPIINKLHTVFPAMGKRSVRNPTASYAEKFYLDHHRDTRIGLYTIIEKYLSAKGYNGTACVLKTLCEVGEKRHENEPGSFLAEIVRAIFSLPLSELKHVVHKRHTEYDEAHKGENCTTKFENCPDSIWNAGFLLETDAFQPQFNVKNVKK